MNKIEFPREGYDGILRSREKIERWFFGEINGGVDAELAAIDLEPQWTAVQKDCAKLLRKHLPLILLAEPECLDRIKKRILRIYPNIFDNKAKGSFQKRILKAFGYKSYRKDVLVMLAKRLNIRCCPYCNAQYTLFIDKRVNGSYPKGVAKFQFDHFYNKSDAPFLSMSLYNLIPACASCNLSKHAGDMSVELNPYVSDIASLFSFRAKDPIRLWQGARRIDAEEIIMVPRSRQVAGLVNELRDKLFLDKVFGRFRDVAQGEFDKVYLYPYYSQPENFEMLRRMGFDEAIFKRLWFENSLEKEDIEKRPLNKFKQDIREQACGLLGRKI